MEILYEDNHVIVVIKPQNVPSMPDVYVCMITWFMYRIKTRYNIF